MTIYHKSDGSGKFIPAVFFLLTGFIFTILAVRPGMAEEYLPTRDQALQCIKIVNALEKNHFLKKRLDNNMSSLILSKYLKRLDPRKHLFTIEDINQFKKVEFRFDDDLKRGRLGTAFQIFNLYLDRSRERSDHIISLIPRWETLFRFDRDDVILVDNDLRQWQAGRAMLQAVWKRELKNHIIALMLDGQDSAAITQTLEKLYTNRQKRINQTESTDIFQIFMNTVTTSFDPHTQYFPPRASEDFDIHMSLSLEGIGAVLQNEYEYTKVVRLIPKGPADKSALLMPGDKIIGVGQGEAGEIIDTIGQRIDHVVKLIRGPKNTYVRLKIIPAKKNAATKTIQIKRDRVKLEDQSAQKKTTFLDHNGEKIKIGIIEIPNFYIDFAAYNRGDKQYKSTTNDVKKILNELKKEKIDGLIIDLRDNGGGALQEASQLTGLFLKTGPTVQIKYKHRVGRLYDEDPSIYYTGPLIVMMNRMSASASEIFAGAIKDYNRGIIVGSRSFGKGTVQELLKLDDGRLKLTRAKFYRVSGKSTQHLGIIPDIKFPQIYHVENTGESSLEGALPWDTTVRSFFSAYPRLDTVTRQLTKNYKQRSGNDPGVNYLEKRIRMMNDLDEHKKLSLNIATRKQRKKEIEQMELDIENQYRSSLGKPAITDMTDENDQSQLSDLKEILMVQTHQIMADFITLTKEYQYTW